MNAKSFFDTIAWHQENGASGIKMSLNCGLLFGVRYYGHRIDCAALLCILNDLMNEKEDGNVCFSFANTTDGAVRDINIDVCADSHTYGMCVDGVSSMGGEILISVREISAE